LAYIDPGTGSMLLQVIIAGVVGIVVYFRKFILGIFRKRQDSPAAGEEREDKAQD
jgi:hypothetical protein